VIELSDKNKSLAQELDEKLNSLETYEFKVNEYEIRNVELEAKVDELNEQLVGKEEKLLALEKVQIQNDVKFDMRLKEKDKHVEILKYEIKREKEQLQFEHDEIVIDLRSKQSDLETKIMELIKDKDELDKVKFQSEQQLAVLNSQMNEKDHELNNLRASLHDMNSKNDDIFAEIDSKFKKAINSYEERIKTLEDFKIQANNQIEEQTNQLQVANRMSELLKIQLNDLQKERNDLDDSFTEYKGMWVF
jgi:chromosome segregation ATPase